MKRLYLFLVLIIFISCGKESTNEPEKKTPTSDSSEYFPLAESNEWRYYEAGNQDATRSIRVWQTITINDSLFYLYGNKLFSADTLYQDQWGRVYKRWNGHTQMWLDFSVDHEGTYQYKLSESLDYTVTVIKNQSVSYDDQSFDNCISIAFDVDALADEEMTYIFAPKVGMVQSIGAWMTTYLATWDLK